MPLSQKPIISKRSTESLPISGEVLVELIQTILASGADFRFTVRGSSMLPFIKDGDTVTIAPVKREKPTIGKVVAYIEPANQRLVIHRLIGQRGPSCLIQGDNTRSNSFDVVDQAVILGCVTYLERNGQYVHLGLGLERYLIAWFSRLGLLTWLGWRWFRLRNLLGK